MPVPSLLAHLTLPVIAAPLFIISDPGLVIAQCRAGVVGAFPALNARPQSQLASWLYGITAELDEARERGEPVAPYAVNHVLHPSNGRLEADMDVCARFRVPLIITSLEAPGAIVPVVHAWGGLVFHDVTGVREARRAIEAGVDGLNLVCAGAGGHAGTLSPLAFVDEVRAFWSGPLVLAGGIATGRSILAAQMLGTDFAMVGTRFIATTEARAADGYKAMLVQAKAADVDTSRPVEGRRGNYLRASLRSVDPEAEPRDEPRGSAIAPEDAQAWRDVWSAGHEVGAINDVAPTALVVAALKAEYLAARAARIRLSAPPATVEMTREPTAARA